MRPLVSVAACRWVLTPSPAASTPKRATVGESKNAAKPPIAFDPPPLLATCQQALEDKRRLRVRYRPEYSGAGLVGGVGARNNSQGALDGRRRFGSYGQVGAFRLETVLIGDEGQRNLLAFGRIAGRNAAAETPWT